MSKTLPGLLITFDVFKYYKDMPEYMEEMAY